MNDDLFSYKSLLGSGIKMHNIVNAAWNANPDGPHAVIGQTTKH